MPVNSSENVIVGGNGFIGTNIANLLLKSHQTVRTVDSNISSHSNVHQVTIRLNPEMPEKELKPVISGKRLFILLGQITSDFNEIYELATLKRLLTCIDTNVTKQVIFISSALVYGNTNKPAVEADSVNPLDAYSVFKYKCELLLNQYFATKTEINLHIARLSNVYGGAKNRGLIGILNKKAKEDPKPVIDINGEGNQTRDYIHISDAAKAIVALNSTKHNDVVNISYGRSWSLLDVVNKFNLISPIKVQINFKNGISDEVKYSNISNQKLKDEYGYIPKIALDEGLKLSLL